MQTASILITRGKMLNINNVFDNLEANHSEITNLVPNIFDFSDDEDFMFGSKYILDTALQNDGKILAAGEGIGVFYNQQRGAAVIRYNLDGSLDDTVHTHRFNDDLQAIGLQSDGKIIVCGNFSNFITFTYDVTAVGKIARLNNDFTLDDTFGTGEGFDGNVYDLKVLPDDSMLCIGNLGSYEDNIVNKIVKINNDGSLNSDFNSNVSGVNFGGNTPQTLFIQSDNKILIGGANGLLIRLNSDGSLDGEFTAPAISGFATSSINAIGQQADEKIIIAGSFNDIDGHAVTCIARLNTNGSYDSTFGLSGNGLVRCTDTLETCLESPSSFSIYALAVQPDNKIIISGNFNVYDTTQVFKLIRLESNGSLDETFAVIYDFDDRVKKIKYYNSNLIILNGYFFKPALNLAVYNSSGVLNRTFQNPYIPVIRGINDGGKDMYDGANFIITDKIQSYDSARQNEFQSENTLPSTHKQCRDNIFRNINAGGFYKYVPVFTDSIIKNDNFYKIPSWINVNSNDQVGYGVDENGFWFVGNANNSTYLMTTNFEIPDTDITTVTFTFLHDDHCSDQGICFYHDGDNPIWVWGPDNSRIACQYNCPSVWIYGKTIETSNDDLLEVGLTYTAVAVYNPNTGTTTLTTYLGEDTNGTPISSLSLVESLGGGNFRVGIYADSDGSELRQNSSSKSYFKYLKIEHGSNTYEFKKEHYFGSVNARYFTNMYQGMFVMAATGIDINEFAIVGDIGSDGDPPVIDIVEIYPITSNGKSYTAFYKSNYNADNNDPSINHFIIVPGSSDGITHLYDDTGEYDDDCLQGLVGKDEIYYFLVARSDSQRLSDEEATALIQKFMDVISAEPPVPPACTQAICGTTSGLACDLTSSCVCSKKKLFPANCYVGQIRSNSCSYANSAYLPAITVCRQRLI